MRVLTEDAVLVCLHEKGRVKIVGTQTLARVEGRMILVERDPEGRSIVGCPMYGPAIRPCQTTLKVDDGYSDLVRVEGRRVCLDTVNGLTDGTPPGVVEYKVRHPGQELVTETP
jgi:hypothetical protein